MNEVKNTHRGHQFLPHPPGLVSDEYFSGYPLHRENRENGPPKKGKTQGIWKFCQNTGNLVCSSIVKVKDFSIFVAKSSQFCVCNSRKSGKLAQGKHRKFENAV